MREALQAYQVAPETSGHHRDGHQDGALHGDVPDAGPSCLPSTPPDQVTRRTDAQRFFPGEDDPSHSLSRESSPGLRSAFGGSLSGEMMDAVVEIHRVLYRGREDVSSRVAEQAWAEQGREVKRVVERWFEEECGQYPMFRGPLLRWSRMLTEL